MKKTRVLLAVLLAAGIFSCTNEELTLEETTLTPDEVISKDPLTIPEINNEIKARLQEDGDFNWQDASDHLLWSAVVRGDNLLTVGFGETGNSFRSIDDKASIEVREQLKSIVFTNEALTGRDSKDVFIGEDDVLNLFDVYVENIETIQELRKAEGLRYIEPSGYRFQDYENQTNSGSGCGFDGQSLSSQDYSNISPGALVPWNYGRHNIVEAWSRSTGSGVGIGVIDTGLSPQQSLLNSSGINDGSSSGRYVKKYGTYVDSWWPWSNNVDGPDDRCGHGTSMAAAAAAPRNNDNLPVGVAYNANLISYRGTKDVVLDGYQEQRGVANALKALGNRSDVKVVSMSIGYPFSIGRIKDAVRYAHDRGKMIIAAGGTSTTFTNWVGVIFPANMSETVAVTGIRDNGYNKCDICHDGSKIDFTIVMEKSSNGRKVPVLGYYNGQGDYVGGSSVATAMTAGIAALIWSKYPSWSRDQVFNRMKQSSELYPNKDSDYGYGNIDALQAVQ